MTAFPIGVSPEFILEKIEKNGQLKKIVRFKPLFAIAPKTPCPQFSNIDQMTGIRWKLPGDLLPGRYKIRTFFCNRLWEDMPVEIFTPEFDIIHR
jgi:hypothetical protein